MGSEIRRASHADAGTFSVGWHRMYNGNRISKSLFQFLDRTIVPNIVRINDRRTA